MALVFRGAPAQQGCIELRLAKHRHRIIRRFRLLVPLFPDPFHALARGGVYANRHRHVARIREPWAMHLESSLPPGTKLEPGRGRYIVLRTKFHGGGIVSRHDTATGAARAVHRLLAGIECQCGCVGIWDRVTQGEPPTSDNSNLGAHDLCAS